MEKQVVGASDRKTDGIGGLRAIACLGIVMMHVLANSVNAPSGAILTRFIDSFTDFVFLFMVVSAYGMCCGYYQKIMEQRISMEDFFRRRFSRVFPFFAFLVAVDVILSHTTASLYEGFADLTLLFGFFSEKGLSVIGVGWYLGLTFVFYLVFPFFCVLLKSKKHAWTAMAVSLLLNLVCDRYFELSRANFAYSLCYFMAGGLIFLYRDELMRFSRKCGWLAGLCAAVAATAYYGLGGNTFTVLALSAALVIFAIGRSSGLLCSRPVAFIGSLSMEIYLCHMMILRAAEKVGLTTLLGGGWPQYVFTVLLVFFGAAAFAYCWKKAYGFLRNRFAKMAA